MDITFCKQTVDLRLHIAAIYTQALPSLLSVHRAIFDVKANVRLPKSV